MIYVVLNELKTRCIFDNLNLFIEVYRNGLRSTIYNFSRKKRSDVNNYQDIFLRKKVKM